MGRLGIRGISRRTLVMAIMVELSALGKSGE